MSAGQVRVQECSESRVLTVVVESDELESITEDRQCGRARKLVTKVVQVFVAESMISVPQ